MFSIISIMFLGIGIGYLLRNLKFLEKVEKSTSLTRLPDCHGIHHSASTVRLRYSCYFSCWAFR